MRIVTGAWVFDLFAWLYAWFTAQEAWRGSCRRLAAHLPEGGRLWVVDLGCGPGVSTFELARLRPDARVAGMDYAARMLREAQRRVRMAGLAKGGLPWVRGDAARLPFGSGALDVVTGHSFLYLLPDRERALAEMWRVLRPGGRVVLMEPNQRVPSYPRALSLSSHPGHWLSIGLWRPFSLLHGRFTPASLRAALESAGFVDCRTEEAVAGLGVMAWADKPYA